MNKDIINKNSKGELNGYQERYFNDNILHYKNNSLNVRGNFKNGLVINYCEYHFFNKRTEYNIR